MAFLKREGGLLRDWCGLNHAASVVRCFARALAWFALAGCSENGGTPPVECKPYVVPASTDLQQPQVKLRADLMPLFAQSCGFSSCHGNAGGGSSGVFLGAKDGTTDPGVVRQSLVGVAAPQLPSMPLVTPGDPSKSYLMRKLDGDQCVFDAQCTDKSCGQAMPRTGEVLPVSERDKVRRWIAQGAKDD